MKKLIFCFLFISFVTLLSFTPKQDMKPLGTWMNADKEAKFEIFECGTKLCGKIIWLKDPLRDGKPKLDINNPETSLKSRPIMGMVFMKDFVYDENNKWDNGTIYDPKTGKTYSCYMRVLDKDKMEVKGYIGISLIGRSQIWTRTPWSLKENQA